MKLVARNQNGLAMVAQFEFMKLMWNLRCLIDLMTRRSCKDHVEIMQRIVLAGCKSTPFAVPADVSQVHLTDEGWSTSTSTRASQLKLSGKYVISFGPPNAGYIAVVDVDLAPAPKSIGDKPPVSVDRATVECSAYAPYCRYLVRIHLNIEGNVLTLRRDYAEDDQPRGELHWLDRVAVQQDISKEDATRLTELLAQLTA